MLTICLRPIFLIVLFPEVPPERAIVSAVIVAQPTFDGLCVGVHAQMLLKVAPPAEAPIAPMPRAHKRLIVAVPVRSESMVPESLSRAEARATVRAYKCRALHASNVVPDEGRQYLQRQTSHWATLLHKTLCNIGFAMA